MSFDLYVDSSANIPDALLLERGIRVISYSCFIDGAEQPCYTKPFRETAKAHYRKMRSGADMRTSLINSETIKTALSPSLQAGRDVFLVTISSGISGTYAQALGAREELLKQFKDRKIVVADSANASMGEGLLALRIADLRDMGESIDACGEWFEDNRFKLNSVFTVGDLRYLRKGGRISAITAFAGTILGIKPILRADGSKNAKLVFAGKERGRKKALSALLSAFDELAALPENQTVAITHADCEEEAFALADALKERGVKDVIVEYYDLCSGTHAGPDTVALFFWGPDRRGSLVEEKAPAKKPLPAVSRK